MIIAVSPGPVSKRLLAHAVVLAFLLLACGPAAAADTAIYGISAAGEMMFYRHAGTADGANTWAVEQKKTGIGWNGFRLVAAGRDGALYGIQPNGDMLFYRFAGLANGANVWAVEQKTIGTG